MLQNAQLERLIDVKKMYHLFFSVRKKKPAFYFRYSSNHSSRQIFDNILWSLAREHELFSTDVCLSRYVNNC